MFARAVLTSAAQSKANRGRAISQTNPCQFCGRELNEANQVTEDEAAKIMLWEIEEFYKPKN